MRSMRAHDTGRPTPGTGRGGRALRAGTATAAAAAMIATGALPALAADPPTVWKFDMGTATSPVAEGYQQVTDATRYSAATGFGIVPADGVTPISRDRGAEDAADRDFVLATAWSFVVDVPNGTYDVTVRSGDLLAGSSTTRTTVTLEGAGGGSLSTRTATVAGTWPATVADGQLTVGITGSGAGGYVSSIVVTQSGTAPEEPEPGTSTIAAPTSVRMAHVTPSAVTLRWNEVAGATGYAVSAVRHRRRHLHRGRPDRGPRRASPPTPSTRRALHYYRVQAIDAAGLSVPSAAAVSSLPDRADRARRPRLRPGQRGALARHHAARRHQRVQRDHPVRLRRHAGRHRHRPGHATTPCAPTS